MSVKNSGSSHESRAARLQEIMTLIESMVKQIPMAEKLMEIKGVGIKTVSGFLAEVGDISRFDNPRQLQKQAGLAIKENSSGKHKGETTISKRGRKRLRYLLFEVAIKRRAYTMANFRIIAFRNKRIHGLRYALNEERLAYV